MAQTISDMFLRIRRRRFGEANCIARTGQTNLHLSKTERHRGLWRQTLMSAFMKGFGCRPREGRRRVFGGRRPKASKNCFELLVKSITAFVTLLASRISGLGASRAMARTITIENAGFELVLRHELQGSASPPG
jgi:hypothetical protein